VFFGEGKFFLVSSENSFEIREKAGLLLYFFANWTVYGLEYIPSAEKPASDLLHIRGVVSSSGPGRPGPQGNSQKTTYLRRKRT
jgi:hypothetical protein